MALRQLSNIQKHLSLKGCSSIVINFDPWNHNCYSIRDFMQQIMTERTRRTNTNCKVKVNVKSDGLDPLIDLKFSDGQKVRMETKHLTSLDIHHFFNNFLQQAIDKTK